MENNHVISSYEENLKACNEEIAALQGQLSAAKEATDSERLTLAQSKKKIKGLQAQLAEKDGAIASLREELESAKRSKAQARREAESACLDKVHGRFRQISEELRQLRQGPMYRLNLQGQTVNNLSLVKDLLGADPPELSDELDALEQEMITYGGATEEFEAAFQNILALLLEGGQEAVCTETSQDRPLEPAHIEVRDGEGDTEGAETEKDGDPKDSRSPARTDS